MLRLISVFNPFMPSVPILGHRQTIQSQIRHRRTQRLIRVYTVCIQEFLYKIHQKWKSTPNTPKIGNGLVQLIRMEKSTRQISNEFRLYLLNNTRSDWNPRSCHYSGIYWLFDERKYVILGSSSCRFVISYPSGRICTVKVSADDNSVYLPYVMESFDNMLKNVSILILVSVIRLYYSLSFEPRHEKSCLRGLRPV